MTGPLRSLRAIPMTLTRRGLALLGLVVSVCALWAAVRLRDLLALAALAAAVLLVALVLVLLTRARVRARAEISSDVLTPAVGEIVTTTASVRHALPFSQSAALVWEGPSSRRSLPLLLPRRGEARQAVHWGAERRGPLPLAAAALIITDPLGVASIRVPLAARVEVLVLPTLLPAERLPSELTGRGGARGPGGGRASDAASGSGRGGSSAEEAGGGLREYRAGDPPRRVHWKQSARQDRLLVNVPEHGAGEHLAIALMVEAGAYRGSAEDRERADFEHAVSLAATLVTLRTGLGGARGTRSGAHGGGGGRTSVTLCTVRGGGGAPEVERSASSAAEALRTLARVQLVSDSASSRRGRVGRNGKTDRSRDVDGGGLVREPLPEAASSAFRPTVIVTGALTPAAAALASRSSAGIVIAVSPAEGAGAPGGILPSGWRLVRSPRPEGTAVARAAAVPAEERRHG
jgi:uncharacterized protein (DUF58 family)